MASRTRKRSPEEIAYWSLKALSLDELRITHLARKAGLSDSNARQMLTLLIDSELAIRRIEGNDSLYKISPKGYAFVKLYEEMRSLCNNLGRQPRELVAMVGVSC